jgi:pseudaminic acid biosynthesis-associated methylase
MAPHLKPRRYASVPCTRTSHDTVNDIRLCLSRQILTGWLKVEENFRTDQEAFWAGEFGKEYSERNSEVNLLAANTSLFAKILGRVDGVSSITEFGANIGLNLRALRSLLPSALLRAIEINPQATIELRKVIGEENVFEGSILDYQVGQRADLVLIKGVLIHIDPNALPVVYEKLYSTSSRFIVVCEYYNPSPVSIPYRGFENRLFKRDFAGEMLDRFNDLRLVDYGFVYRRDPSFPLDDVSWFLLEKQG